MLQKLLVALLVFGLVESATLTAEESFVGNFAEPADGGNLDTTRSTFDGETVVIVPRGHASEAVDGTTLWRTVHFAIRGVRGKNPSFVLPLISPGTGLPILCGDVDSLRDINLVWSYQPNAVAWNRFDRSGLSGTDPANWKIEAKNDTAFEHDLVYVSINERFPVGDFYNWLEVDVFTNPLVTPTASAIDPGSFVIGYQSGAPAGSAFSRAIPDMPLIGFVIRDPAATPSKLVILVSGQHPYEGQNKVAIQAATDWILHSSSAEAKAYRAQYTTIVYPFVNPTGELAGLWRGTASEPTKDTNRNWNTHETVPSRNLGIDTVIVHKNAMKRDIDALGLGEPYAVFDYHQSFGDRPGAPDYVLRSSPAWKIPAPAARVAAVSDFAPYYARLSELTRIADMPSDLSTQETLRGYMIARGATLPLTFERSVHNTISSEWSFGVATVQALVAPPLVSPDAMTVNAAPAEATSEAPAGRVIQAPAEGVETVSQPVSAEANFALPSAS